VPVARARAQGGERRYAYSPASPLSDAGAHPQSVRTIRAEELVRVGDLSDRTGPAGQGDPLILGA